MRGSWCRFSASGRRKIESFAGALRMNSFSSRSTLRIGQKEYEIYRWDAAEKAGLPVGRLPCSLRILLENLLRNEGKSVTAEDIRALANWDAKASPSKEIAFMPARVLMQDFTGVPAV